MEIFAIFLVTTINTLASWLEILTVLGYVKVTQKVEENHPYFSYPWYKRLFCLGLKKHRYLTVMAFMIHISNLIWVIALWIYGFTKKVTTISKICIGFIFVSLLLRCIMAEIKRKNRGKWKLNKK